MCAILLFIVICVVKKKRPDLKDLENLVTPTHACCWKEIGVQLNIPIGILNSIEIGYPTNPTWCCNKMWMRWGEIDPEALWDRVIKAIDSPAVSAVIRSFTANSVTRLVVNETLEAVSHLSCKLKVISIKNRYKAEDDNWPLTSPNLFTSVALIHHKGRQTEREVLAVATLQNKGDIDLHKINSDDVSQHVQYFKQSKCTKSISDIFAKVEGTNKSPSVILIEGVPGIGKTALSKEIVFQWANGELLPNITLMFLVYLRDTESHKITSLESFVNYVTYSQVANHILKYITDNEGKNIMIVFDGYDELSEELRKNSFLLKMMTQKLIEIPFCNVVITSRPNASAYLHNKVELRVEILGFTNEDRKAYIDDALKHDNNKIEKVMKYLNNNPAINAYCYIPLNMTILLSFFQNDDYTDVIELPNTQTGINEKFICTTISRYIRKLKELKLNFSTFSEVQTACDHHEIGTPCVGHKKGMPCGRILKEISNLAFKALEKDKTVFTTVELQESCPCLESQSQSENWNGLGLLKPTQLFTVENNLRNVSFNFLHFTVQEILAAYHITLMSEPDQLKCMRETFWENRYYNTWIMYVGLTKNQLPITFKHFLSGNWFLLHTRFLNWWNNGTYCRIKRPIIDDKIKCLHLFQCFSEAENNDLCQYVGQLLQENEIDLSGQTLSAVNILTISLFLTRSTTKHWNILNLSECFIGDDGIEQLHNSFISNNRSKVCIDTLNLSHNNLTQSSVNFIAGLILEWDVKDIMFNEIIQNNLYQQVMHQLMQRHNNFMCNFNENEAMFVRLSQLDYLILSFNSTSGKRVHKIKNVLTDVQQNDDLNTGRLKSIILALDNCTTINYLHLEADISPLEIIDVIALIANNNFMEYLYLPKIQYPGKVKLKMIIDALKSKKSLQYVDMSLITIDSNLINDIVIVMNNNRKLKEIKVSKLILAQNYNDVQHLENYLVKITGLKSLTITGYTFNRQDADKLTIVIKQNFEIWQLNLSNCKIPIDCLLNILSYKSIMEKLSWLDLSSCYLHSKEMKQILSVLQKMKHLQHVNLSTNTMRGNAISEMAAMIKNNQDMQVLSLQYCVLDQNYLRIIIQAMQTVSSLEYVDFGNNKIDNELASDVALLFTKNSKLKELRFTKLTLNQIGFQHLNNYLVKIKGLTTINIIGCSFIAQKLVTAIISSNFEIQELNLSNCTIPANQSWSMLSCIAKLKCLNLSQCLLQPNETKEIFDILKQMNCLQYVDLSANIMKSNAINDVADMIKNNQDIQVLSLPNCVLDHKDRKIIIQAMQTVSSLEYVDFGNNTVDNELASDVALLFTKNSKLNELKFTKLTLNQIGFQHLNNYLVKIKGLTAINIIDCSFIDLKWINCLEHVDLSANNMESEAIYDVAAMIKNNQDIQVLSLQYCVLDQNYLRIIIQAMQTVSSLEYVDFGNNTIDNELASDVALLFTKNSKLKELRFTKLTFNQIGFQHLNNYLVKIKGLTTINIIGCSFIAQKLVTAIINSNSEIQELNLSNCTIPANQSWSMLSCIAKLKCLNLSQCLLQPNETKEIFCILKQMNCLQHVDLSANIMKSNAINDIADMIKSNQDIQVLSLPNCVLDQKDLSIIIQAMQTVSSLEYVDFSNNTVDNELASDVALLFTKNSKMKELGFIKLTLNQNGFQHLNNYLVKIRGLVTINMIDCSLIGQNPVKLVTVINNNTEIQELNLSNCRMPANQSWSMLSCVTNLKYLNLSRCLLQPNETKEIFGILKRMEYLQHVDLSGNNMESDTINDIAAMIKNNEHIQSLSLPNGIINKEDFKIIIQAMQTVSSLEYVDFNDNTVDNELASDVAAFIVKNIKLKEFKFSKLTLNKIGFQRLNNYLVKIVRLTTINIIGCSFIGENAIKLGTAISNNPEIQELNLSNCRMPANQSWSMLSCSTKLKCLNLSKCLLQPNEIKEIFGILKKMKCLQHVDLSGNNMESDAINDVAALIKNNQDIQVLSLPNCVLDQKDLRIIIQAMQTVSSLEYVDFNNNTVDNELASDVALLFTKNSKLKELRFTKLTLNQIGFQNLNNYLVKIKGLTTINIIGCFLIIGQNAMNLVSVIENNSEIQELNLSNCRMPANQSWSMLSCITKLKYLNLSQCLLQPNETKEIFGILKWMNCLQHVDLSTNIMESDAINDVADMIKNNQDIQVLSLPNCVLDQKHLRIIIEAMQTVSSLEYVDFNNNTIDDELASDVAVFIAKNIKLKEFKFSKLTLIQSGFQHLNNYLIRIKGLTTINIIGCSFIAQNAMKLATAIKNNSEIQELNLLNCRIPANQSWSMLSCITKLKYLNLSRCLLQPNETKEIFGILKWMNCLQHVDLSTNIMESDAINDVADMIKNNQDIQVLSLPNCVLDQKHLRIIIEAMQTVSSLEYVDFNNNTVDNELASDVALFFTKNSKLKELRFIKLTLKENGFQHLNNYLVKIRGLATINMIDCSLIGQNPVKLVTVINNNTEIQELNLSNCRMPANQSCSMLSCVTNLKYLNLSRCLLQPNETKEIFGILKRMEYLQHVDLSDNNMESDTINDIAAMIKNNEHIQSLSLPNGIINKEDFKIIIQAMQTVSSLEYVDFNDNTVDNELASDVAAFIVKNIKLKEFKFSKLTLNKIGFQHLNNYLVKIVRLTTINIIGCSFIGENAIKLVTAISNNPEIQELNLSNCRMPANQSWSMLSCSTKLKCLNLSKCLLQPNEIKEIFGILKKMKCLQYVNLSGNNMESDAINDVAALIKNNQDIQVLSLPNCVLEERDLKVIIQAMQTVSSLEYVDFNNNTVDNELASDVAAFITKNIKLKEFKFSKLTLIQSGFQHLNNYLIRIKGLTTINIISCSFIAQNSMKLATAIKNNSEIQELKLSNCRMPANQSWSMLSCITKLKCLNLSHCLLQPNKTKQIFGFLKWMKCLQHVDLSGNNMESDAVNDIAAMIKNNKHIQSLSLPNGIISKEHFKIFIQAMQSISSLRYVDFSTNEIDNELASDISTLFASNSKLEEIKIFGLTLNQSGFQHLMMHSTKFKGIECLSISDCTFTEEDVVYLINMIGNNHKITKMLISNCKMIEYVGIMSDYIGRYDQLEILGLNNINSIHPFSAIYIQNILVFLSCCSKLRQMTLCNCQLRPDVTKQVLMVLKYMRHLETVDLSGNDMTDDSVSDMEAMIVSNKQLQKLCLPNCVLNQVSLKIICQALQTLSSLQYVDFRTNKIEQDSLLDLKSRVTKIIQKFS